MIAIRRIIDYWRDIGEWWLDEPELWFWRVEGSDRGVYELAWNPEKKSMVVISCLRLIFKKPASFRFRVDPHRLSGAGRDGDIGFVQAPGLFAG